MKNLGCPANIKFLLHCHVSPEAHPQWHWPHYQSLVRELEAEGLIEKTEEWIQEQRNVGVYRTTKKGDAYVHLLCNTPPPRSVFVDAAGQQIKMHV